MKSPDTSREMGKYRKRGNRIRPSLANRGGRGGSYVLLVYARTLRPSRKRERPRPHRATSTSPFHPPLTKEHTLSPLISALIKNAGSNAALLNDPATLMSAVPQTKFGKPSLSNARARLRRRIFRTAKFANLVASV